MFQGHVFSIRSALRCFTSIALVTLTVGCVGDKKLTAKKAWEDLETKSRLIGCLDLGGQIVGGDTARITGSANSLVARGQRQMEEEADKAMSSGLPVDAIRAMSDELAQRLVVALPNIPSVKNSSHKVVLAFPSLMDESGSNREELTTVFDSVRTKLFENQAVTNNFVFVSSSERDAKRIVDAVAGKDTSVFRDPLQRDADLTKPVVYDPQFLYVIDGRLSFEKDLPNHAVGFRLTVSVTHLLTRQSLKDEVFSQTYIWHPYRKAWELQSQST